MINISPITALLVSSTPATTMPVPSLATDGVDVSTWNVGKAQRISFDAATVYISGSAVATLTGPVYVWGYRNGQWWNVGALDGGATLTIAAVTGGLARRVDEIAIFSRLAVSCAAVTGAVNYTYGFEPIAVRYD